MTTASKRSSLVRLLAALAGAACALPLAGAAPAAPAPQAAPDEAIAARQVLVMLPMAPAHFRAGAGSGGGYGAGLAGDPGRPARRRLAQDLAREHGLRIVDDWAMPVIGVDCYVMEGPPGAQPRILSALARDPRVAWAQPVNLFRAMREAEAVADPLYPLQPDARLWHAAELHRASTGRAVRVAVIDSGVDSHHPDLAQQVELRENFVDEGDAPPETHGTAVAGIIAARAGNGLGIAGLAPGARLQALRACWEPATPDAGPGARCSSFTLAKALNFAILHEARVINLSLGGPADRLLRTLVDTAAVRGAVVVGAVDAARPDGFPAAVPGVLAVAMPAAPAPAGMRARILLAPGADVPTCLPGARWGFVSGSSYAAAHVSGLVALLAQLHPHASPVALKNDLVTRASSPALERTAKHGADGASGVTIDACASIARAAGTCVCSCHEIGKLKTNRTP
jgi:subtilisin family serine protease